MLGGDIVIGYARQPKSDHTGEKKAVTDRVLLECLRTLKTAVSYVGEKREECVQRNTHSHTHTLLHTHTHICREERGK